MKVTEKLKRIFLGCMLYAINGKKTTFGKNLHLIRFQNFKYQVLV